MNKSAKRVLAVTLAVLCMLCSIPQIIFTSAATSVKYEAEDATLNGTSVTTDSTASGGKCVGTFGSSSDYVEFDVNVANSGYYDITICSKGIGGTKKNILEVNDENCGEFSSNSQSDFAETTMHYIYLESGSNSVKITKSWGWIYLDYITVDSNEASSDIYNVSKSLINPNASDAAKRLMSFIVDNYGKNVITGQQADKGYSSDEVNAIYNATGKKPALIGLDLMDYSQSNVTQHGTNGTSINVAKNVYNAGGIVAMCWHWRMYDEYLKSGTNNGSPRWWQAFYTNNIDLTKFDLSEIMNDTNGTTYKQLVSDIDYVAGKLKTLKTANIPVLFRPLHEASGGWFWWGSDGPEPYKKLWRLMYDRLTNYHGLNNLIWVWNGQDADWYPGDEYCDIVGTDIYNSAYEYSPMSSDFATCVDYGNGNKVVTLSENGVLFDIDKAKQANTLWSWFCVWGGNYAVKNKALSTQYTEASMWTTVYQHENAITLDELPDLKNYPLVSDDSSNQHIHNYVATETTPATCTTKGLRTYTCSGCGDTYTAEIAATGHKYSSTYTIDKPATCTEAGSKSRHCTQCDAKTSVTAIPATGHNYTSEVTKAATCTEEGVRTYTCSNCEDTYTEVIEKIAHNYVETVVAPTATEQGYTLHECSVCGDSYKDNYVDPIDVPVEKPTFVKSTFSLEGVIGANLQYNVADAYVNGDYEIEVTAVSASGEEQTLVFDKNEKVDSNYVVTLPVKATDLTTEYEVTLAVKDAKGNEVASVDTTITVNAALNLLKSSPETGPLANALQTYGYYAQRNFGLEASDPIRRPADLSGIKRATVSAYKAQRNTVDNLPKSVPISTQSLLLEGQTTIRVYFGEIPENVDISKLKMVYTANGKTERSELQNNGTGYYADIANINAQELSNMYSIHVEEAGVQVSDELVYGAYSYVAANISSSDVNLQNTVKALYNYGEVAKAYFG